MPHLNLFDHLYNRFGAQKSVARLEPAPAPRRFAQGMAGAFMLAIALSLAFGRHLLAWALEGFLVAALAALIFGRFCLGSYAYLVLTGQTGLAKTTLPWSRPEDGNSLTRRS